MMHIWLCCTQGTWESGESSFPPSDLNIEFLEGFFSSEAEFVRSQVSELAREYLGKLTVALSNNEEYEKVCGLTDWSEMR